MTSLTDIRSTLIASGFTNEELDTIAQAVKYARAQLSKQNRRSLMPGDTVKFTSNRNGMTYTGTVSRVKIKYILVRTNAGLFNVPANMLEAV